jgi:hypothetical protein
MFGRSRRGQPGGDAGANAGFNQRGSDVRARLEIGIRAAAPTRRAGRAAGSPSPR